MQKKWLIAGPLILILLVVGGLIFWVSISTVQHMQQANVRLHFISFDTISAEETVEESYTLGGPGSIELVVPHGDITIGNCEGEEIQVSMHKTGWGNSKAQAEDELQSLSIEVTREGDQIKIEVIEPPAIFIMGTHRSPSIDFTIYLPDEIALDVDSHAGDVSISDLTSDVTLQSEYGDIQIQDLDGGKLQVNSYSGDTDIRRVDTPVKTVDIESEYGDITLEQITAVDMSIQAYSGKVTAADLVSRGEMAIASDYADVSLSQAEAKSLDIEGQNGKIELDGLEIEGRIEIHSEYGDIALEDLQAEAIEINSQNGAVDLDGISGPVAVDTEYGDITITQAEAADLTLAADNSSIFFEGSLGSGPHAIESKYGDITLHISEDSSLSVDITTTYGEVVSDFDMESSDSNTEVTHWSGEINEGGATLIISTENGSVKLLQTND